MSEPGLPAGAVEHAWRTAGGMPRWCAGWKEHSRPPDSSPAVGVFSCRALYPYPVKQGPHQDVSEQAFPEKEKQGAKSVRT